MKKEEATSSEEDDKLAKVVPKAKSTPAVPSKKAVESSDDGSEESDEEPQTKKPFKVSKESSSDEDSADEEGEPVMSYWDLTVGATLTKLSKKEIKALATPRVHDTGSKTLFCGNLSSSIDRLDVEKFFKDCGEVVDVSFLTSKDGSCIGFGHVEFDSVEAALKAVDLNGRDLMGRPIALNVAIERGSYTRYSGHSIIVRGFDTSGGLDEIKSSLQKHFGSCGEMIKVFVPEDTDSGAAKGIAYIYFSGKNGFSKALALDGSEFGEYALTVEDAQPRGVFGGSGSRGGGRDEGGISGGRDGGRFGGHGGRDGGRFGSGGRGGCGTPSNKPNLFTFDD